MVVIINGTIGIGKTWIARWLMSELNDAAYIEGDTLGFVSQSLFATKTREGFAIEVGFDLISSFRRKGAKIVVYDYLFADPALLKKFVANVGDEVKIFYLSGSSLTIGERIKKRGRPQAEQELEDTSKVEKLQRDLLTADELGIEIVTDGKEPAAIVEEIKTHLFK